MWVWDVLHDCWRWVSRVTVRAWHSWAVGHPHWHAPVAAALPGAVACVMTGGLGWRQAEAAPSPIAGPPLAELPAPFVPFGELWGVGGAMIGSLLPPWPELPPWAPSPTELSPGPIVTAETPPTPPIATTTDTPIAAPEPASVTLLAFAFGLVLYVRRRR